MIQWQAWYKLNIYALFQVFTFTVYNLITDAIKFKKFGIKLDVKWELKRKITY